MAKTKQKEPFFTSPQANVLCAVMLLAMGICGAHAIENIANDSKPDIITIIFFIFVLPYLILQTLVFKAANDKTDAAQKDLIDQSKRLELLVTTLPPEGFLEFYSQKCIGVFEVFRRMKEDPIPLTRIDIDPIIRGILAIILQLVRDYDRVPATQKLSANIMVMNYSDDYCHDQHKVDELSSTLHFAPPDVDPRKLAGILKIEPTMVVIDEVTERTGPPAVEGVELRIVADKAEEEISRFSLPVSATDASAINSRYLLLPGAPYAAKLGLPNGFADTEKLCAWMEEKGDFTQTTTEGIKTYFTSGPGRDILSFWSFPLSCQVGGQRQVIGVLNIDKNETGLLSKHNSGGMFNCLMAPIFEILAEFLTVWLVSSEELPAAADVSLSSKSVPS